MKKFSILFLIVFGAAVMFSPLVSSAEDPAPSISEKFISGNRVQTVRNLNTRSAPSLASAILGVQSLGSFGTLLKELIFKDGLWWWKINYDKSPDGWAAESYLAQVAASTTSNQVPSANAGPDQTVTDTDGNGSEKVILDGSLSGDADGIIVSYEWKEGTVILGTDKSIFPLLSLGVHTIALKVTDDGGATVSDEVFVTVKESAIQAVKTATLPKSDYILSTLPEMDFDNDGKREFIFKRNSSSLDDFSIFEFYEGDGNGNFQNVSTLTINAIVATVFESYLLGDAGDGDKDGLKELLISGRTSNSFSVRLYEATQMNGYPASIVWEFPTNFWVEDALIEDLDQDGRDEIVIFGNVIPGVKSVRIFENRADNTYAEVFNADFSGGEISTAQCLSNGADVDGDGKKEIFIGGLSNTNGASLFAIENTGDDTYTRTWFHDFRTSSGQPINCSSLVPLGDTDKDGKAEFVVGGLSAGTGDGTIPIGIRFFVLETDGPNSYTRVTTVFDSVEESKRLGDTPIVSSHVPGDSRVTAFDVDRDGNNEIIISVENCPAPDYADTVKIMKNIGDDTFGELWRHESPRACSTGVQLNNVGAGDFDADGKTELVFAEYSGGISSTNVYEFTIGTLPPPPPPPSNISPVANAGPDKTATDANSDGIESITLNGSGSDSDGSIVGYEWKEGSSVLGTNTTLNANFTLGIHTLVLTVTDDKGAKGTDDVIVQVLAPPAENQPPQANAGPDVTATDTDINGTELLTLYGSGVDPDGSIVWYEWRKGTTLISTNQNFTANFVVGTHTLTLTVKDNAGAFSSADSVTVTILTPGVSSQQLVVGDRVKTTANLNVRSSPALTATLLGTQSVGSFGTLVYPPQNSGGYVWWKIDYDIEPDGWSVENYLEKTTQESASKNATVGVVDGYDEKNAKTLVQLGKTQNLQASDNVWWETEYRKYTSYKFGSASIPANAIITSVVLSVEHGEEVGFSNNKLEWNIGTGWPSSPKIWSTTNPQVRIGDKVDSWDVTKIVNTPTKVNTMEFRVKNNDNSKKKKTKADHVYAVVNWQ